MKEAGENSRRFRSARASAGSAHSLGPSVGIGIDLEQQITLL
jgi:hypothetical protein